MVFLESFVSLDGNKEGVIVELEFEEEFEKIIMIFLIEYLKERKVVKVKEIVVVKIVMKYVRMELLIGKGKVLVISVEEFKRRSIWDRELRIERERVIEKVFERFRELVKILIKKVVVVVEVVVEVVKVVVI